MPEWKNVHCCLQNHDLQNTPLHLKQIDGNECIALWPQKYGNRMGRDLDRIEDA